MLEKRLLPTYRPSVWVSPLSTVPNITLGGERSSKLTSKNFPQPQEGRARLQGLEGHELAFPRIERRTSNRFTAASLCDVLAENPAENAGGSIACVSSTIYWVSASARGRGLIRSGSRWQASCCFGNQHSSLVYQGVSRCHGRLSRLRSSSDKSGLPTKAPITGCYLESRLCPSLREVVSMLATEVGAVQCVTESKS